MGAGPVPIPHAVAQANGVVINHLGETMYRIIDGVKKMAQYAFQTSSSKLMGVAGPSSAAMEMGITNLVWPGKKVLRDQCRSHNLFKTLYALGMSFRQEKYLLQISKGMAAIEEILSGDENYYVT